MSEQSAGTTDSLPRPTPRQLVIRAIGTAVVIGLIAVGLVIVLERRDEPAGFDDLAKDPRTVSYGRLSLQIPAGWTNIGHVDECGHVQGDTLILGLAGVVTCRDGERDPEATDVVMSSLSGRMAAPAPDVRFRPVTLPSGLRAERGTTVIDPVSLGGGAGADDGGGGDPAGADGDSGGDSGGGDSGETDEDAPPLRTTVLRIPALDAQVVATSRDRQLVKGILNTATRVPDESPVTPTVAYLSAALDIPPGWEVNAVACGIPTTNTVIAGHARQPALTTQPGEPCPTERPPGVTDIYLEALDSAYGSRWGVIANDPVTLLDGVKGVRGTRTRPRGQDVTVVLVPNLRVIAVAQSDNQALVDMILSTMHRAVPTPPAKDEQPTPTTTPEPTARPTLPAGVRTRTVRHRGLALAVPRGWSDGDVKCGVPQSDTVVLGAPDGPGPPRCTAERPPGASGIVIDRLYGSYGSLWQSPATEPITLPSGLSGLRGMSTTAQGLPVTVLAFPTIDAIIVASAADDGDAQALIDGILTTTRETRAATPSAG